MSDHENNPPINMNSSEYKNLVKRIIDQMDVCIVRVWDEADGLTYALIPFGRTNKFFSNVGNSSQSPFVSVVLEYLHQHKYLVDPEIVDNPHTGRITLEFVNILSDPIRFINDFPIAPMLILKEGKICRVNASEQTDTNSANQENSIPSDMLNDVILDLMENADWERPNHDDNMPKFAISCAPDAVNDVSRQGALRWLMDRLGKHNPSDPSQDGQENRVGLLMSERLYVKKDEPIDLRTPPHPKNPGRGH